GQSLNGLLSGSLITAIVLNIPNVERLLYEAILQKDDLVIMACLMLLALALLIGNLFADIALAFTDPRIRYD
ncbi:ABC transporter permease, partial [Candidatus Acetothermia bacterium]|nr:ABC transporter permease [Candidatus Acetothermia bacterium]